MSSKPNSFIILLLVVLAVLLGGGIFSANIDLSRIQGLVSNSPTGVSENTLQLRTLNFVTVTPTPIPTSPDISGMSPTFSPPTGSCLKVSGNKIIDCKTNQAVLLRGAHIQSELNIGWSGGGRVASVLNPAVFAAMRTWNMNVIRIPTGAYNYANAGATYLAVLDRVIQQANAAGLYVVIDDHEDAQAGGGNGVATNVTIKYWTDLAVHYKNNPMVLFDLLNETQYGSWQAWQTGMQQVIDAVRVTGDTHILIVDWKDNGADSPGGFGGAGNAIPLNDPTGNLVYSVHMYFKTPAIRTPAGWDSSFGNLSNTHPVFIGEWAMLPNARYPSFCSGLDAVSGTALVNSFLDYMQAHAVHWTAWSFTVPHMILDYNNFTPTVMTAPWCCGSGPVCSAGMGTVIKNYLLTH